MLMIASYIVILMTMRVLLRIFIENVLATSLIWTFQLYGLYSDAGPIGSV